MSELVLSFRRWLRYGEKMLASAGVADAYSDAWLLLEYAANIDRTFYALHGSERMDPDDAQQYFELLQKRASHIPVQYLTGEAYFMGESFFVTPDVLIPRQDTETLVTLAMKKVFPGMQILDLCTGSGCILLSLLKDGSAFGTGTDISEAALVVAAQNAERLGIRRSRVKWIRSDLFAGIGGRFDLIVSNPPYIARDVIPTLDPEVSGMEPHIALDGGEDGLDFEKKIAFEAREYLNPGGWLFLEIGFDQGEEVASYLAENGYQEVRTDRDLGGRDRVVSGRWSGKDQGSR